MSGAARSDAEAFEQCIAVGGLALFPTDTVYGLGCDAENRAAVQRVYLLKRRELAKPAAVMFFELELALAALPQLAPATRSALGRLLPGSVTVLLPNPECRFPLACGSDPSSIGVRVPVLERLVGVRRPILQSSANHAGGPDPRRLEDVAPIIRASADLVLNGEELPGTPSTVLDLRTYERSGSWTIARPGAVSEPELAAALG